MEEEKILTEGPLVAHDYKEEFIFVGEHRGWIGGWTHVKVPNVFFPTKFTGGGWTEQ